MLYSPSNEVEKMLNQMIRQSQYQHQNNIKAIIRSKSSRKEEEAKPVKKIKKMVPTDDNWKEFKMVEVRCKCPILLTTSKKKKGGGITLRRFEDTGYRVKCPIHSP